jgi:hypothetical protein
MNSVLKRSGIAALAVFMAVMVMTTAPAAAATPALNFNNDKTPNPTVVEDELTISEHDRAWMDAPLEYYDDSGDVAELNASVNQSQTTPVGLRFDQVDADVYSAFPRTGDSWASWTAAGNWSKSSGASSSVTISDADADGVDKVSVDATVVSGETATATFAQNVSITEDPTKRVLTFVGNVDSLSAGSHVHVRVVDGDGDYHYANISQDNLQADSNSVIANGTGNGFVFQQRVNDLPSSGTLNEISKVEIVTTDADAKITIAGLDAERKGTFDLAEIRRDTDGDGENESTTATDIYEGGVTNITSLSTLGSEFDTAVINDLHVYDVRYEFAEMADGTEYDVEFSSADDYSYPQKLELYVDMEVPAAIDLSHGSFTMEFHQGVPDERYVTLEVASNVDSDEAFGNISESSYTDKTGALTGQGDTAELLTSPSADTTYRVHAVILYQTEEVENIMDAGGMGPTASGNGGFWNSIWGQITGVVGGIVGAVAGARFLGISGGSGGGN